ncbi:hypothetical protein BRC62_05435 [Halobacteriales archaeon QH_10_67_13]|nr:MAG: hypothetical protein BRC62_05435 [Halobacteriales archaeon QH_10_67_13]
MPFVTRLTLESGDGDVLDRGVGARGTFDPWRYTVYTRLIEVVGHGEFARALAEREYPDRVHVRADIEQLNQTGT